MCYLTVDSISEGVGSSQIIPLLETLAKKELHISLVSFEKEIPSEILKERMRKSGIDWNPLEFKPGFQHLTSRLNEMRRSIPDCNLIHARSDFPAFSAITSQIAPVLWDVRSLWADQKAITQENNFKKAIIQNFRMFESFASKRASGMSTLTNAVVPVLESRHRKIPTLRTVVPTAVDLERFVFSSRIPEPTMGLYSGTYSSYYDLALSHEFVKEVNKIKEVEVHWARPLETSRDSLMAGETHVFTLTQTEMPKILSDYAFGVSICRIDAGESLTAAMPTKIAEFLATGRPVVVNAGLGDMDLYLAEFNAGVTVSKKSKSLEESAAHLLELLNDPDTPYRCRGLAEKYFDIKKGANRYLDLYSRILS
jgi:glycosyltransferase involved in cell wall biosynthesis